MKRKADLMGQRFGRLTVIGEAESTKHGQARWLCRCDCGTESVVRADSLKSGSIKSCGCYNTEMCISVGHKNRKHGMGRTRLYNIWSSMKARCYNANSKPYKYYGARGIAVCGEWRNNFIAFRDWAIANGYADNLTLDRRDNNGHYTPENCRWIALREQFVNRRSNRYITYGGKRMTISQWSKEIGCSRNAIAKRLSRGWTAEQAIKVPFERRVQNA